MRHGGTISSFVYTTLFFFLSFSLHTDESRGRRGCSRLAPSASFSARFSRIRTNNSPRDQYSRDGHSVSIDNKSQSALPSVPHRDRPMPRSRDFPLREESSATMRSIEGSGDIGVSTDETAENSKQFESRDSAAKFRQLRLRSRLDIVSFRFRETRAKLAPRAG